MNKFYKKSKPFFSKHLTFFWILISLLLFFFGSYCNWQISLERARDELGKAAGIMGNTVDKFIEDLFQEVYTLPINKHFTHCDEQTKFNLRRISLNNPNISGLIISANNKLICSTIPHFNGTELSNTRSRSILGPFINPMFDHPIYIIQQELGPYKIGIIILANLVENKLIPLNKKISVITLYDRVEQRTVLHMQYNVKNNNWIMANNRAKPITKVSGLLVADKVTSIGTIDILVLEAEHLLLYDLLYNEVIFSILFLIVFYILFVFIRILINKNQSLLSILKLAVKNKEFYPEYQPIFDRTKNKYVGAEVLLRWQQKDNEEKIIMPDLFIKEAEETGVIVPITLQIVEMAFQHTFNLFKKYPDFHLGINISALHFTDAHFFNQFSLLAEKYAIPVSHIIFELTERDLLDTHNPIFYNKMNLLRKAGFSLAVDDYGTGHASISYLQNFPFNYLKIDKMFVQSIGTKAITESLNDAIITMAKNLNLMIIAEGVETEEQVQYLTDHDVVFFQGWYYSKAVAIDKLTCLLTEYSKPH